MTQIQMTKTVGRWVYVLNIDGFVKSRRPAFRSWFDTSPRTENQILTVYLIRSP